MKISIKDFKGRAPKFSSRSLPDRHGQAATNCRLQSNDLEPYKGTSNVTTLGKVGPVNTIYPIDRLGDNGGPFWLHWQDSEAATGVEVAKGFTKDDSGSERVYFTGTDRPRVTNLSLATSGGGSSYPIGSRFLGLPIPIDALVATSDLAGAITPLFTYDGDDLGQFSVGTGDGSSVENNSGNIRLSTDGQDKSTATVTIDGQLRNYRKFLITTSFTAVSANANSLSAIGINFGSDTLNGSAKFNRLIVSHNSSNDELRYTYSPRYFGDTATNYVATPGTPVGTPTFGTSVRIEIELTFVEVRETATGSESFYDTELRFYDSASTLLQTVNLKARILNGDAISVFAAGQNDSLGVPVSGTTTVDVSSISLSAAGPLNESTITNYVYTFINEFGEESAPSPPSNPVNVGKDLETTLTGFSTNVVGGSPANANYGIIGYRLYRAVTGTLDTQYQLVTPYDQNYVTVGGITDVLPVDTSTWTPDVGTTRDKSLDDELGEVLQSTDWLEPPTDARNIVALPNGIMLLSKDNVIYPSVQFRPHAYPESYQLATDFPIVAMSSIETTAVVMTQESTYLVVGSDPSQLSMSLISSVYPCVQKRSVARWREFGVVYACRQGLVAITSAGAKLLTENHITEREWANYYPETMQGVIYQDTYFGFYTNAGSETQCVAFDLRDGGIGFIDLDVGSSASFVEPLSENLYIVQNSNELKTWNTGSNLTYEWKSKDYLLPYPTSFECAQLKGRDPGAFGTTVTVNFYANQSGTPFFTKSVSNDSEFLLPATVCRELEVELIGTARINQIEVSTDMSELN